MKLATDHIMDALRDLTRVQDALRDLTPLEVTSSLLRPAQKAQDPGVQLDENNLVVEKPSYITPQQARDYFYGHIDINMPDDLTPALERIAQRLDLLVPSKVKNRHGVITTIA